jgi:hypothetical protein
MIESFLKLPYYSLEQSAKIIDCSEQHLRTMAANRDTQIHVLTGGRAHWYIMEFDENDNLIKRMNALPPICLVPFEYWTRREAGEDCQLNQLTSIDAKNNLDGIGDACYLGPWYNLAGRELTLANFVILHDEIVRLKANTANQRGDVIDSGINRQRDEDFVKYLDEEKPNLKEMKKKDVHAALISRNRRLWQAGFEDWVKKTNLYSGIRGRRPVLS